MIQIFAPGFISQQQWFYADLFLPILLPTLDTTKNFAPISMARSSLEDLVDDEQIFDKNLNETLSNEIENLTNAQLTDRYLNLTTVATKLMKKRSILNSNQNVTDISEDYEYYDDNNNDLFNLSQSRALFTRLPNIQSSSDTSFNLADLLNLAKGIDTKQFQRSTTRSPGSFNLADLLGLTEKTTRSSVTNRFTTVPGSFNLADLLGLVEQTTRSSVTNRFTTVPGSFNLADLLGLIEQTTRSSVTNRFTTVPGSFNLADLLGFTQQTTTRASGFNLGDLFSGGSGTSGSSFNPNNPLFWLNLLPGSSGTSTSSLMSLAPFLSFLPLDQLFPNSSPTNTLGLISSLPQVISLIQAFNNFKLPSPDVCLHLIQILNVLL